LRLDQAVSLDELQALDLAGRRAALLPLDALLASLPRVDLDAAAAARFAHGQRVPREGETARLRVYGADGALIGLARCAGGWLEATRLVARAEAPAVTTAQRANIAIEHRIGEAS